MTATELPITSWLDAWSKKDRRALEQLVPLVFDELRKLAHAHLQHERAGHTLQPTDLVHEVYLKLVQQHRIVLQNRTQFFAFASRLMRRILVDHHRARQTDKRGGGEMPLLLEDALLIADEKELDVLRLDDALRSLAELDSRQARIVEMRFFTGLSIQETASVLGLSAATIKREWSTAKAWLRREIRSHA